MPFFDDDDWDNEYVQPELPDLNPGGWLDKEKVAPEQRGGFAWATFFTASILLLAGAMQFGVQPDAAQVIARFGYVPGVSPPGNLLTHLFVHPDIFHVGLNVGFLLLVGRSVEGRLGAGAFFVTFLLGGVASALLGPEVVSNPGAVYSGAQGSVIALTSASLLADFSGYSLGRAVPPVLTLWPGAFFFSSTRPGFPDRHNVLYRYFGEFPHSYDSLAHCGAAGAGVMVAFAIVAWQVFMSPRAPDPDRR